MARGRGVRVDLEHLPRAQAPNRPWLVERKSSTHGFCSDHPNSLAGVAAVKIQFGSRTGTLRAECYWVLWMSYKRM